jgi:hypothetical protein
MHAVVDVACPQKQLNNSATTCAMPLRVSYLQLQHHACMCTLLLTAYVFLLCMQGFKAAVGLVGAASKEQDRQQKQRKQNGK